MARGRGSRRRVEKLRPPGRKDHMMSKMRQLDEVQIKFQEMDSKMKQPNLWIRQVKKKYMKKPTMCVSRVWYDRDNSTVNCDAQRLQRLLNFAELAIDFFNKTSPVNYNLVELVNATAKLVSGYLFHLTFTAKHEDDEDAKTFDAWVYEAMRKPPRVKSVEIVDK